MDNAVKIIQLRQAKAEDSNACISSVFDQKEVEYLERLLPTLEGKTKKLKNPYPPNTLSRAAWIIARLGGWKGYESSRPPGMKTFKRGLDQFNIMAYAWNLSES